MKQPFDRIIFRAVLLFLFWMSLSGKTDPVHVAIGICTVIFISYFSLQLNIEKKQPKLPGKSEKLSMALLAPGYIIWLLGRIFLAALHVAKLVLHPRMPIRPEFIEHKTILTQPNAKVLFANSITLTPGTITANLSGDTLIIHRLDKQSSGDIDSHAMEKEIQKVFDS